MSILLRLSLRYRADALAWITTTRYCGRLTCSILCFVKVCGLIDINILFKCLCHELTTMYLDGLQMPIVYQVFTLDVCCTEYIHMYFKLHKVRLNFRKHLTLSTYLLSG
jgi:hypothetical protein